MFTGFQEIIDSIRIPETSNGYNEIINGFQEVIDSPYFQRLRNIKQLDLVYLTYPSAVHTRFEHSIGVLHHLRNILDNIEKKGYKFDEVEKKTTQLAGLLHDISHPPYSHATEFVLMDFGEPTHDEKNIEILEEMESYIKQIEGINSDLFLDIFKRKNPLYKTIWSLVGADVLDYVNRDANRCGINISSDTNSLELHAFFDGEIYGIDSNVREIVRSHINSYKDMYVVYNRRNPSLAKGIIRRGLYECFKEGLIQPKEVWQMTDSELEAALRASGGVAEKMYKKIRNRNIPKTFLTLKLEGMGSQEEIRKEPIKVLEMPEKELMKIVTYFGENIENVIDFEKQVEEELKLEPGSATLAEMKHLGLFIGENVSLHNSERGWTSLYDEIPNVEEDFKLDLRRKYALRVGVEEPHRKEAFEKSQTVTDILSSFA